MQLAPLITDVSVHLWRRGGYFSSNSSKFYELRLRRSRFKNARGSGPSFFGQSVPLAFEAAGACVVTKVAASLAAREAARTVRNSSNSGRWYKSCVLSHQKQKRLEVGAQ